MGKFVERLETRRLLAFAANINFQNASAAVPAGYIADTGKPFGARGNGYTFGWNTDNSSNARERNDPDSPDQRYDTLTHTQLYGVRSWEIAVPNGQYHVRIVGGDAQYFGSTIRYNAEGVLAVSGNQTSSNKFIDGETNVTVSDGRLSISNAAGSDNNKICFIEIDQLDGNPSPTLSISATDSHSSESGDTGAFKITRSGSTASSLTVGYTISGSATNGSDYNSLSGSVTIPAGASSANITVTPKDDDSVELDESATLTLKSLAGYVIGGSSATVTIADNDSDSVPSGQWPTSWTKGPSIPKARWESTSIFMDGKIWVFGGWMSASSVGTQQVDVFDTKTNTWSTLKNYAPVPHTHSAAAADYANHVIYFVGGLFGSYPGVPTNKAWKFDTKTLAWSELPAMSQNRSSGVAALINNELHYFGGVLDDRFTNTDSHIYLDLDNTAAGWKTGPDMPDGRDHMGHAIINGKVILIGGEFGHDRDHIATNLVDQYDPITKTWTRLAPLPINKSHMESSTFVYGGKIYCAGGQLGDQKGTDNVCMYDPAINKWTTIGKLPTILEGPVVVRDGNRIIVTTGDAGSGPTGTTYFGYLS